MNTIENAVYEEISSVCNNANKYEIAKNTVKQLFDIELEKIENKGEYMVLADFLNVLRKYFDEVQVSLEVEHVGVSLDETRVCIDHVWVCSKFEDGTEYDFDHYADDKALKLILPFNCMNSVHEGVYLDLCITRESCDIEIDELDD